VPNREQRRNGSGGDATIKITSGGDTFEMRFGDFSALDEFDYYKITGQKLMMVFNSGEISSFEIAGLLWLYRRPYEPGLTFEEVAKNLKWSDLESVEVDDGTDEDEPEAVATSPEA
jgi:hypothetical protein